MKKTVMVKAWEIAKGAVVKFGGKVKEYFSESLKMAWVIVKSEAGCVGKQEVEIQLSEGSNKHKTWVAEVVGTDAKWGFKREFVTAREDENVKGKFFTLVEGKVYDVNCAQSGRKFATVRNGEVVELSQSEVKAMFA